MKSKKITIICFIVLAFARLCLPKCGLNIKKVRCDISTSLRLARFHTKLDGNMSMSKNTSMNKDMSMNQNDDEDDLSDYEELAKNLESFLDENIDIDSMIEDEDEE